MNKHIFEFKEDISRVDFKIKLLKSITNIELTENCCPIITFNNSEYEKYLKSTNIGTIYYLDIFHYISQINFEIDGVLFIIEFEPNKYSHVQFNYMKELKRQIVSLNEILDIKIHDLLEYMEFTNKLKNAIEKIRSER